MARGTVAALFLTLAFTACASSESSEDPGSDSASTRPDSQSATVVDTGTGCDFASVHPTHLPWLKRGERVPPPTRHHGPDEAAWLDWRRPDWSRGENEPYYVVLRRDSQFMTSSGQLVPGTQIPDAAEPGRLHSGEVGFSPSIVWFLVGATTCEWLTLQLSAPGMSREKAEDEISRIARSFRST